jgi:hypothetical protein
MGKFSDDIGIKSQVLSQTEGLTLIEGSGLSALCFCASSAHTSEMKHAISDQASKRRGLKRKERTPLRHRQLMLLNVLGSNLLRLELEPLDKVLALSDE